MTHNTPTDRGYAFIGSQADGTRRVLVAVGIDANGSPQEVFAVHTVRTGTTIDVAPEIDFVEAGAMRRTTARVQVVGAPGVVSLRPVSTGLGPLLDHA